MRTKRDARPASRLLVLLAIAPLAGCAAGVAPADPAAVHEPLEPRDPPEAETAEPAANASVEPGPRVVGDLDPTDDAPAVNERALVIESLTVEALRSLGERVAFEDNVLTVHVTVRNEGDEVARGHLKVAVAGKVVASGGMEVAPGEAESAAVTGLRLDRVGTAPVTAVLGDVSANASVELAARPRVGDAHVGEGYALVLEEAAADPRGRLRVRANLKTEGLASDEGRELVVRALGSCVGGEVDEEPAAVARAPTSAEASVLEFVLPACEGGEYGALTFTVTLLDGDMERSLLPIGRFLLYPPQAFG